MVKWNVEGRQVITLFFQDAELYDCEITVELHQDYCTLFYDKQPSERIDVSIRVIEELEKKNIISRK